MATLDLGVVKGASGENATINGLQAINIETSGGIVSSFSGNKFILKLKDDGYSNSGAHNAIYRGKNLGSSLTSTQINAINDGTFEDLYIGDYWNINNRKWLIACLNPYYTMGDTSLTKNSILIIPEVPLYNFKMNDTNTTEGGYVGSKMYTEGLEQAKTIIKEAFPNHVLKRRAYFTNAVSNGCASAGAWFDSEVDLMTEQMVYGSGVFSPVSDGTNIPTNYRVENTQLPLFRFRPDLIHANRNWYWLRDVVSSACFAFVSCGGGAYYIGASNAYGVRPAFLIS